MARTTRAGIAIKGIASGCRWLAVASILGCSGWDSGSGGCGDVASWFVAEEPRLRIGEEAGDPAVLFDGISAVRLLRDGGVVVADRGFANLRVFGGDGSLRASMGRAGDGPGEFGSLSDVVVLPPDTILAYDGSLFRITRFLTDGTLLDTRTIRPQQGSPELYLGRYSNGDAALAWIQRSSRDPSSVTADVMGMGRFDRNGSLTASLGSTSGIRRMGSGPLPFSPFLHARLVRDSLYFTDGQEPRLVVLDEQGDSVKTLSLPLPALDPAGAWAALREALAERGDERMPWSVPPEAETEPIPVIAEVLVDRRGSLWLKHYDPRTDSPMLGGWQGARGGEWTIVTTTGDVVAEAVMPEPFVPLDISDREIAGIWRDALGVERVVVFELEK